MALKESNKKWLFYPYSNFKAAWDILMTLCLLFNGVLWPY